MAHSEPCWIQPHRRLVSFAISSGLQRRFRIDISPARHLRDKHARRTNAVLITAHHAAADLHAARHCNPSSTILAVRHQSTRPGQLGCPRRSCLLSLHLAAERTLDWRPSSPASALALLRLGPEKVASPFARHHLTLVCSLITRPPCGEYATLTSPLTQAYVADPVTLPIATSAPSLHLLDDLWTEHPTSRHINGRLTSVCTIRQRLACRDVRKRNLKRVPRPTPSA